MPVDSAQAHATDPSQGTGDGTIRQASILDVPAMVRALSPVKAPEGVSEIEMSRILRLTLTHVAIEHGMAWIETTSDGTVIGIAIAVPTWHLDGGEQLPGVLVREAAIDAEPMAAQDLPLGWLGAVGRAWLVAHPVCHGLGETGPLVSKAVAGAQAAAVADGVRLLLIASRAEDRVLASQLGFTALDMGGTSDGVWIGVKEPA